MKVARILQYSLIMSILLKLAIAENRDSQLRIYIDKNDCDFDYIKNEITYVDYALDLAAAEVHIFQSLQATTSGAYQHTIYFVGQHRFETLQDTLIFFSSANDSEDIIREKFVQVIKLGLVRYLAHTDIARKIIIKVPSTTLSTNKTIRDKWNYWVFTLSLNMYLYGEQSYLKQNFYSYFTANRTTANWKTEIQCDFGYDRTSYEIDSVTKIETIKKNCALNYYLAKSIDDHWSVGAGSYNYSDSYHNNKYTFCIFPALEYNFYPYSQASSRELRTMYKFGYVYNAYFDTTIYNKIEERLFHQTITFTLDVKQQWGSLSTIIFGSCCLPDLTKNRLHLNCYLNTPIYRGFSLNLNGYASMIHDQISLAKGDLIPEEIILRIKQLSTQYDYSISVGISYRFGSLYSNVVNPRFGYGL